MMAGDRSTEGQVSVRLGAELSARHGLYLISGWYSGFLADRDLGAELKAAHSMPRCCGNAPRAFGTAPASPDGKRPESAAHSESLLR